MTVQLAVVLAYLALMLLIGVYASRFNKSLDDYFVAGHRLTLWFNVNTMAGVAIGAGTTMGVAGMVYEGGISAGWILIGFTIGFVLIAILIGRRLYETKAITIADVIETRFGAFTRTVSSLLVVIQYIGIEAAQFIAMGLVAQSLLGIEYRTAVLLMAGITILYTLFGGLMAVALTDVVQMILNAVGVMIVLPLVGLTAVGGLEGLKAHLPASFFDPMAMGWATIAGFMLWIIPQGFLAQELWIRLLGADSARSGVLATVIAAVGVYLPYMVSVVVIGLVGAVLFPGIQGDAVMPHLITQLTGPFLGGVLLASLVACVMSGADSMLLVASSNIVKEGYLRYINPRASDAQVVSVSRWCVLLVGVVSVVIALYGGSIIGVMQDMATPFAGGLFPVILALFFWRRATNAGATWAMVVALATSAVLFITRWQPLGLHPVVPTMVFSTVVLLLVSLGTRPERAIGGRAGRPAGSARAEEG